MSEKLKIPTRNKHGLVIPPNVATLKTEESRTSHLRRSFIDRHHLYFPKYAFKEAGSLALEFREHRSNSVWLPRTQHNRLHRRYHQVVEIDPKIFIPEEDVMTTYLDEVHLLDELKVCVRAVEMIDAAIDGGLVRRRHAVQENRTQKLERIREVLKFAQCFEIVTNTIIADATSEAIELIAA